MRLEFHAEVFERDQRATFRERIVVSVGRQLSAEYGAGFADKNLRRMMQFAEVPPDEKIVVSLIRQLTNTKHHDAHRAR